MRLFWIAGNPMKFNASTPAFWNDAPAPPPSGVQPTTGGFTVISLTAASSAPTLGQVAGGFTVS